MFQRSILLQTIFVFESISNRRWNKIWVKLQVITIHSQFLVFKELSISRTQVEKEEKHFRVFGFNKTYNSFADMTETRYNLGIDLKLNRRERERERKKISFKKKLQEKFALNYLNPDYLKMKWKPEMNLLLFKIVEFSWSDQCLSSDISLQKV